VESCGEIKKKSRSGGKEHSLKNGEKGQRGGKEENVGKYTKNFAKELRKKKYVGENERPQQRIKKRGKIKNF